MKDFDDRRHWGMGWDDEDEELRSASENAH